MKASDRLFFLDNLRTFLIFLVVLYHAGIVYESSGFFASFWIVDDPVTSDLPGLVNLVLDIFIMATMFFVSGYLTPASLDRKGAGPFLRARFKRLMLPWVVAVFTLIPAYKVAFLHSRGLPQESWTTYFHFTNGIYGMNWLWFLPVLFFFNCGYVALKGLRVRGDWFTLKGALAATLVVGVVYSWLLSILGLTGWTHTLVVDFQNERLLIYFLYFLLGARCYRRKIFTTPERSPKLYIAVSTAAWIPVGTYVVVLLNMFLRPGQSIFSEGTDVLLLWLSFHLSLMTLLYCAVTTFKRYFNRSGRIGAVLGPLSFQVYILHMIVMAPAALMLLEVDISANWKYLILTVVTYSISNLVAFSYNWVTRARTRRGPRREAMAQS